MRRTAIIILVLVFSILGSYPGYSQKLNSDSGNFGENAARITQTACANLILSTTSLNFGTALTGSSVSNTFSLSNIGDENLVISSIVSDNSAFQTNSVSMTLSPGHTTLITVIFSPVTRGAQSATLTINSNVPFQTVTVYGTGIGPVIQLSRNSIDFGNAEFGFSSEKTFLVRNQGETQLNVTSITVDNPVFSISPASFSVIPGNFQVVSVTFTPPARENYSGTITIRSNDYENSIQTIPLIVNTVERDIELSLTSLDMGGTDIGDSSTVFFAIRNVGTSVLTVSSITIDNDLFSVSPDSAAIAAGDSQIVSVLFIPLTYIQQNAQITILSNDFDEGTLIVDVTAVGLITEIDLSDTTLSFGEVSVGTTELGILFIRNIGSYELIASSISNTNSVFNIEPSSARIAANDSIAVLVWFTPSDVGEVVDTITVLNTDNDESTLKIVLSGTGVLSPNIAIPETIVEFGNMLIGLSDIDSFIINNEGSGELLISSISCDDSVITIEYDTSVIAPADSMEVILTFSPVTAGEITALITILTNDPDEGSRTVHVTGTAILMEPPVNVQVADVSGDQGHALRITWNVSPTEDYGYVSYYRIFRSRNGTLTNPVALSDFSELDSLIAYGATTTILIDSVNAGIVEYMDDAVPLAGQTYYYWMQSVGPGGSSAKIAAVGPVFISSETTPSEFVVFPPYPNPFNPFTTIRYELPVKSFVEIVIYDVTGRKVAVLDRGYRNAGLNHVSWNAETVASGLYFYRISAGNESKSGKLILVK